MSSVININKVQRSALGLHTLLLHIYATSNTTLRFLTTPTLFMHAYPSHRAYA